MKKRKVLWLLPAGLLLLALLLFLFLWKGLGLFADTENMLLSYMECIESEDYEKMYGMLTEASRETISKEEFTERNQNIYQGIEARDIEIKIKEKKDEGLQTVLVYETSMDTAAGLLQFENQAVFTREIGEGCGLEWEHSLIFPNLGREDKVQVTTIPAQRGQILDRNGQVLAGAGTVSQVGVVPGKLDGQRDLELEKLGELLEMSVEEIETKLGAAWVKDDSFVPLKMLEKIDEIDLLFYSQEEAIEKRNLRQELLELPGVMLSDTETRVYPLKEAASHLTGYIQDVTAEDLEEREGEGYHAGSKIGKSGLESLYEKELKGKDGCKITITNSQGTEKEVLAYQVKEDGQDITLTIDAGLQRKLYEKFKEDESCHVAMNPKTGEVLALVSTPSYDANDFIFGLSQQQWDALNEDEQQPMLNRFRNTWCPGSSFKPIIGAIGVSAGKLDPNADLGMEGLQWQKDQTWGGYYVTTLHEYSTANLVNALIYSDNIYFAKAALQIGADTLKTSLEGLGFGARVPFDIWMTESQYSNSGEFDTEVQLADSGYGQGQMLANPLHLACLYTAFLNNGDVIKPSLLYTEDPQAETWISQAFSPEAVQAVSEGLLQVIEDPNGTGAGCRMDAVRLAGKTGTAEIKDTVDDVNGTELGWLAVYTPEESPENSLLLVSMVEDVKERGGSGYVVGLEREILEEIYAGE